MLDHSVAMEMEELLGTAAAGLHEEFAGVECEAESVGLDLVVLGHRPALQSCDNHVINM